DIFQKFKGVEIFPVGNIAAMKEAFKRLRKINFNEDNRKYNIQRLDSLFIREKTIKTLLSKLDKI